MQARINCDMGESFALYSMGNDEAMMPYIGEANVACGFHGSDPDHMRRTVRLAKAHDVAVGAHVSLPDLQGFGRREMTMTREEIANLVVYQIGALLGFLTTEGLSLNHVKPHGALYGMAAREAHVAHGIADAVLPFDVPVFGLADTLHESIYVERGLDFHAEFFADLEYDDEGGLIITREHVEVEPEAAARRARRAVDEQVVRSTGGHDVAVRAETICVHSDTPNAVAVARAVHDALARHG